MKVSSAPSLSQAIGHRDHAVGRRAVEFIGSTEEEQPRPAVDHRLLSLAHDGRHIATQHHNDAIERRRFDISNYMPKQRARTKRQGLFRPAQASRRPCREDDSDHIGHGTTLDVRSSPATRCDRARRAGETSRRFDRQTGIAFPPWIPIRCWRSMDGRKTRPGGG